MKRIKSIAVAALGGTVLAIGIALIVLPGPAFIVIPAGLAILAIEFAWARRLLRSARAVLPRPSAQGGSPRKSWNLQSVRRAIGFLGRQLRRTVSPKRKAT